VATARCPAASVQDVIRADGDAPLQPASYKRDSFEYAGSENIAFERYMSRAFFDREMDRMWPRTSSTSRDR
jgi:hypothetical protein